MNYIVKKRDIKSGQEEVKLIVMKRFYERYIGKSGNKWYIAKELNSADHIYCVNSEDQSGFGGATIRFNLDEEHFEEAVGPWHSNSEALYSDTGIDIRAKHATRVVLGKGKMIDKNTRETVIENVIHIDQKPVISIYDRGKRLAKSYANELGFRVWYYIETSHGSILYYVDPDKDYCEE